MDYMINDRRYRVVCRFDGEMFEAFLQDEEDGRLPFYGYGYRAAEARREMESRLLENGIQAGVCNVYVDWNALPEVVRHKMMVAARKFKSEVMGEWHTEEERFEIWRCRMYNTFQDVYPRLMTRAFYNRC